jgi:hypothetical protein
MVNRVNVDDSDTNFYTSFIFFYFPNYAFFLIFPHFFSVFSGCPYCKLAAELLTEKYGITITYVDIENPEKR